MDEDIKVWVLIAEQEDEDGDICVAVNTHQSLAEDRCSKLNESLKKYRAALDAWHVPQRKLDPYDGDLRKKWIENNPPPVSLYPGINRFYLQGPFEMNGSIVTCKRRKNYG